MRKKIITMVILSVFILIGVLPSICAFNTTKDEIKPLTFGITLTVDDDRVEYPNADFTSLNEAVDYSNYHVDVSGIDVYPGEYLVGDTAGESGIEFYEPGLYLRGVDGALKTIIDGEGWDTIGAYTYDIEISGFTIKSTDSLSWDGIVVGRDPSRFAYDVKIHDCIFDLPHSPYTEYIVYGLVLSSYSSDVEVYNNDFICDEENALDDSGTNHYWHDNFWEEWDGFWDEAIQGEPYEKNGVVDLSPRWDPCIIRRPSQPIITEEKISGRLYKYTIVSFDEDGDGLNYEIEWGDDGWHYSYIPEEGFIPQGEEVKVEYRFKIGLKHLITVYVHDEHDQWCREPTVLKLSRSREVYNILFESLLARFPILNKLFSLF